MEEIEGENNLVNNDDQTVVVIRPKYYIGSSGSIWASDYVRICHEHPSLFQELSLNAISNVLNKFVCRIHDMLFYFANITMKEDVQSETTEPSCQYRQYGEEKLNWLLQQSEGAVLSWREEKEEIPDCKRKIGNELENKILGVQEKTRSCKRSYCELIRENELWEKLENISKDCFDILLRIEKLQLPKMCCNILKATDAGPGVGVSNTEVRFRDVEIARMHSSDLVNRIHRAPGDSGQNEAERSNAAIGDALVDGGAMKWQYFGPFDDLSMEEIENLSITELKKREEECMEKNAWKVSEEIRQVIDDEPGPAGDFLKCFVTSQREKQFFFNSAYLMKYFSTKSESGRKKIPGNAYFSKINGFMNTHCEIGEMYFEYLKGSCEEESDERCEYCISHDCCCCSVKRVPRPYPDQESSGYHYLTVNDTPNTGRSIDDYHPRVQMKKIFAENKHYFDHPNNIEQFSKKFLLTEDAIRKYVDHMKLLELKRAKRVKEKAQQADAESKKNYNDYDWKTMFRDASLGKLKAAVLDKYLDYHNLGKFANKKSKLEAINSHIIQQLSERVGEDEGGQESESESQSEETDSEEEYIVEEIGLSDSSDDGDNIGDITEGPRTLPVYTRSARRATRFQVRY